MQNAKLKIQKYQNRRLETRDKELGGDITHDKKQEQKQK